MAVFASRARGQNRRGTDGKKLTVPFSYAADRGSLLIRARINRRAVVLIIDTGSSHTILAPLAAGIDPKELKPPPRTGVGIIGFALRREVTLEVGRHVWKERLVSVMDLSPALSAYREKIDGLLGMDFLLQFSGVSIDLKERLVTFVP